MELIRAVCFQISKETQKSETKIRDLLYDQKAQKNTWTNNATKYIPSTQLTILSVTISSLFPQVNFPS